MSARDAANPHISRRPRARRELQKGAAISFRSIGVVGAGLMGSEIALVFALGGHPVVLIDLDEGALSRANERMAATLEKGVTRGFFTEAGAHFFSAASRMALVEVIPAFSTAPATVDAVIDLLAAVGKRPIRVNDVIGFAVNRVLRAFLIEAVRLVEEGVATPEDIDMACRLGLGHPVSLFELMDTTTSSLCVQAQELMRQAYGERFRPRPLLKQRVAAGLVGGRGPPGWRT